MLVSLRTYYLGIIPTYFYYSLNIALASFFVLFSDNLPTYIRE